jgi:hypothetical protein
MAHDGTGAGWDETAPADGDPRKDGAKEIRDLRIGVRIRMEEEHITPAASSVGGRHKEGSAMLYRQDDAPTDDPGGTALGADDDGRAWLESDTGILRVYDGANTTFKGVSLIPDGNTDISTDVVLAAGWENTIASTVLISFTVVDGSAFDVEVDYGSGWVIWQGSVYVADSNHVAAGSVMLPYGGKIRVNPASPDDCECRYQSFSL